MSGHCENCGCRVYSGACTNCDEAIYIADQYYELDLPLPPEGSDFRRELADAEVRQHKRLTESA